MILTKLETKTKLKFKEIKQSNKQSHYKIKKMKTLVCSLILISAIVHYLHNYKDDQDF